MNYNKHESEVKTTFNKETNSGVVINILNIKKAFGDHEVLKGFSLQVNRGENVAVLGKSGSGKSVLIKCIVGLIKPDSGYLEVLGKDILKLSAQELDHLRTKVGFLFQSNALYDSLTVKENLEFPLRRLRVSKSRSEVDSMIVNVLESVGLPDTAHLMPSSLSGGMRKRIGVARTLILQPEIILYDEPTSGLDPITSREIGKLILEVQLKYNTSSIIISHDMNCIKQTAQQIAILHNGMNYKQGTYQELMNSSDKHVNSFFK